MASIIYNSLLRDILVGNISFDTDAFKAMLVTSAYTPDKDGHSKRSHVSGEVSGTGYTAGGMTVTASVGSIDTVNDRVPVTFTGGTLSNATLTARGAVIYKSRGGAASADELVGYIDFAGDVSSTGGTFTLNITSPLHFTNPS